MTKEQSAKKLAPRTTTSDYARGGAHLEGHGGAKFILSSNTGTFKRGSGANQFSFPLQGQARQKRHCTSQLSFVILSVLDEACYG